MALNGATRLSRKQTFAVGLILLFGIEFLLRDVLLPANPGEVSVGLALVGEWVALSWLVFLWVPRVEKETAGSLGVGRFRRRYLVWGVLVYLLVLVASTVSGLLLGYVGLPSLRSLQPLIQGYSVFTLVGLFLTGTFLEEVFYRGYLIERMTVLTKHRWVAALVSWLLFTLVHLKFFGVGPTIDTSVISAALVLLYLKEKSVWPCVVVHGINDALAFLIFPLLM